MEPRGKWPPAPHRNQHHPRRGQAGLSQGWLRSAVNDHRLSRPLIWPLWSTSRRTSSAASWTLCVSPILLPCSCTASTARVRSTSILDGLLGKRYRRSSASHFFRSSTYYPYILSPVWAATSRPLVLNSAVDTPVEVIPALEQIQLSVGLQWCCDWSRSAPQWWTSTIKRSPSTVLRSAEVSCLFSIRSWNPTPTPCADWPLKVFIAQGCYVIEAPAGCSLQPGTTAPEFMDRNLR